MSKKIEHMCMDIMKELKCNGRLNELGKLLLHRDDLEDMFRFVWNIPEFQKCLVPQMVLSTKSQQEAQQFLADGDTAFQNKLYKEALELYNLCIMKAPHPDITVRDSKILSNEESTTNEWINLYSAYSKRSELLFELKQYTMCIADIDRAVQYGIPEYFQKELQERKNNSLLALQSENESKDINNKNLSTDNTIKEAQANECTNVDNCQISLPNVGVFSKTNEELLFSYKSPSPPKFEHVNSNVPCLSNSLEVKYNPLKGRFIEAGRDIHPGEIVLVEEPYMSSSNTTDDVLQSRCSNCLQRCHAPIPCSKCHIVVFCNESCRTSAMRTFHHVECNMLPNCISLGIDNNAIVACRLLAKTTFKTLKNIVPRLKIEKGNTIRKNQGFNEEGNYTSADYRTIYNLESNIMERSMLDIFHKCAKAFLLTQMLRLSKLFFVDESGEPIDPELEDIILIGALLLNHTMSLPQNIFAITEFQLNLKNIEDENNQKCIGEGVYATASLFNHSCNANTMRCHYGNHMVIYAKSFIQVGTELTVCYRHNYRTKEIKERRKQLHKDYKFICSCDACLHNWPLLKDLQTNPKISKEKLNVLTNQRFPDDENLFENQLQEVLAGYTSAFKNVANSKDDNDKEVDMFESSMIKTIEFMDKYVELPCKEHAIAQMMLKHCVERKASSYCFRK